MVCLDACVNSVDLTQTFKELPTNTWSTIAIPLTCLAEQGVLFGKIMAPFELHSNDGTQIKISDVVIGNPDNQNTSEELQPIIPQICSGD